MTLYEYSLLCEKDKVTQLWKLGTHLHTIKYLDKSFALYGINKFYVELEYFGVHNDITSVRTFKQGEHLQKYLDCADINF